MPESKDFFRKLLPYTIVFISFSGAVILLILFVNYFILPHLIHDRGTLKVPDVVGKTLSEAEKMLNQAGLKVQNVADQYSESVPSGTIINQVPKGDQEVKSDRGVYLTVSKGTETIKIPNLVGQHIRTARIMLSNAGLQIGSIDYKNNEFYGKDTIISQNKTANSNVPYNTPVNLVVSLGGEQQVAVPNLFLHTLEEAQKILSESNLVVGDITYEKDETYLSNSVIKQSLESGTLVKSGTKINFTVTK
jgi:eukaryotic-like serine/threonine-protein kinase